MNWLGNVRFGADFLVFSGRAGTNVAHRFPTVALLVAHDTELTIIGAGDTTVRAAAVLVPPMAVHQIAESPDLGIVFFHRYSRFRSVLPDEWPGTPQRAPIRAMARDAVPIGDVRDVERFLAEVDAFDVRPAVHPVVGQLLAEVTEQPGRATIREIAAELSISTSWLRELVRRELGAPMSSWLLWRKSELAGAALARGASIAEAAVAGGFADQAHFARSVKQQLGIVPSQAAAVLR